MRTDALASHHRRGGTARSRKGRPFFRHGTTVRTKGARYGWLGQRSFAEEQQRLREEIEKRRLDAEITTQKRIGRQEDALLKSERVTAWARATQAKAEAREAKINARNAKTLGKLQRRELKASKPKGWLARRFGKKDAMA